MDDQTQIIDGDVVEEPTQITQSDDADSGAAALMGIEGAVKNHQLKIDELTGELKRNADMLADIFANEPTYQDAVEVVKEATKAKMQVKATIINRPEVGELNNKVKQMRADLKELKEALSDYLREYQRTSGSNVIEGYDGELREIVYVAKLVKKSTKN